MFVLLCLHILSIAYSASGNSTDLNMYFDKLLFIREGSDHLNDKVKIHPDSIATLKYDNESVKVRFRAFGESFLIVGKREKNVMMSNAQVFDGSGYSTITRPRSTSYAGLVQSERSNETIGTFSSGFIVQREDVFQCDIKLKNGTIYYIEPSFTYCKIPCWYNAIIYTVTSKNCSSLPGGCISLNPETGNENEEFSGFAHTVREKIFNRTQMAARRKFCFLEMIADHTLYEKLRNEDENVVVFLTKLVGEVNRIYSSVDFDGDGSPGDVHLGIGKITVFKNVSDPRYYFQDEDLSVGKIVHKMTYEYATDRHCFVMAVTHRLRISHTRSGSIFIEMIPGRDKIGGICDWQHERGVNIKGRRWNVGVITSVNPDGEDMSFEELAVLMAHEIGHAFGAKDDDPKNEKCYPDSIKGEGNYIMADVTRKSLTHPNNFLFSPCTQRSIARTLAVKGDHCFEDGPICGNGIKDEGEECDCGPSPERCDEIDPCCTPPGSDRECTVRTSNGSECSPAQGSCCTFGCTFAPAGVNCRSDFRNECPVEPYAKCTGISPACPPGKPMSNGNFSHLCNFSQNTCTKGECNSTICRDNGLNDCVCPKEGNDRCEICCMDPDASDKECVPASKLGFFYPDQSKAMRLMGTWCSDLGSYRCDAAGQCRLMGFGAEITNFKKLFIFILHQTGSLNLSVNRPQELTNDISSYWSLPSYWSTMLLVVALCFCILFAVLRKRSTANKMVVNMVVNCTNDKTTDNGQIQIPRLEITAQLNSHPLNKESFKEDTRQAK